MNELIHNQKNKLWGNLHNIESFPLICIARFLFNYDVKGMGKKLSIYHHSSNF